MAVCWTIFSIVSQVSPCSKESESAYILFYQQVLLDNGSCSKTHYVMDCQFDDSAEMKTVESLMLSSGRPNVNGQPTLKRTNSNRKLHYCIIYALSQ